METLLYLALWGAAIFLMMRFGCGAHMMGHGHGHERGAKKDGQQPAGEMRWVPPETDTDPVCGKAVSTGRAKSSVHAGNVHYFCSHECREAFEAAPDRYAGGGDTGPRKLGRSHA
jgi:YHS domain-containing protein